MLVTVAMPTRAETYRRGFSGALRRTRRAPMPMAMKPSITRGKAYVSSQWMWLAAAI